ncbi:hypothetical protein FDB52_05775 [Clostridium botulinum]|nr:hypothetical protein [Clostridium botulinum]NFN48064.1 hypothetical protein [Clostridium botulinum]
MSNEKIKFRGKCISSKYEDESIYLKWIYGDLHHIGNEYFIYCDDGIWHEVNRDTIGQFTGLVDEDGNDIYVGNIVEYDNNEFIVKYDIGSFMLVRISDSTDMYSIFENCWNDDVYPMSQLHWENDCEENSLTGVTVVE